jgi:2-polyprenyl-6-hydroxyphenyl methylase/3-demethylubiquinone-9 3-methyltransferase
MNHAPSTAAEKERFYDTLAADWETKMNRYEVNKRLRLVFERLLPEPEIRGKSFLDGGCGIGLFSERAKAMGADVTAIDIGERLVDATVKRCGVKGVPASLLQLPFDDDQFAVVMSSDVIEHTQAPRKAVSELCRVVAPGGTLVITVPNRVWVFSAWVADKLRIRPYLGNENWVGYRELRRWVEDAGFEVREQFGFNLLPLFYKGFHTLLDVADKVFPFDSLMVNVAIKAVKKSAA